MKFIYLGCEGAPEVSTHYGVEFTIGQPAEVTDSMAIAKLSSHPHFKAVSEKANAAPAAEPAVDGESQAAPAAAGKKSAGKKSA